MGIGSLPNSPNVASIIIVGHSGTAIAVTDLSPELHIYEDVFSNTLSCQIVIGDGTGLLEKLPLVGNEKLVIKIRKGATDQFLDMIFVVYKLSHITPINQKMQVYTLECVSQEYMNNILTVSSKAYSGSSESIIQGCLSEVGSNKKFISEPSATNLDIISAYWNPFYTINMVAARTLSVKGSQPSYFFFEDFNQNFNFVSLETLFGGPKLIDWSYRNANLAGSSGESHDLYVLNTIIDFHVESAFDMIEGAMDGLFGGILISKDVLSKGAEVTKYNYLNKFNSFKHLNKNPITPPLNSDKIDMSKVYPRRVLKYSHQKVVNNRDTKNYKNWALQRLSFIEQVDVIRLHITVPANSTAQLGANVNININDAVAVNKTGISSLSGNWIISAIHHRIKTKNYLMDIELIRDSLN